MGSRDGSRMRLAAFAALTTAMPSTIPTLRDSGEGKHLKYVTTKPPATGRNQSCPCGSGKKYKKCCLGR